jgi:ribosome-associated protein
MGEGPRAGEREAAVAARREEAPEASAALARRVAAIADSKKAEDAVALDVRDLVGYTDYLVIVTARNERQAKAIHDEVYARLKKEDERLPARVEGEVEARWVLIDYVDCVLHVFVPEMRERYRLEVLWGEAERLDLELGTDDDESVRRAS